MLNADERALFIMLEALCALGYAHNTEAGNTYTETQYIEWLTDAGFCRIEVTDLAEKRSQLMTAFLGIKYG